MIFIAMLALAGSAPLTTEEAALTKWRQCVDDNSVKLTDDIGQTPYTPARRQLVAAIARVSLARCERLWGWELKKINKRREAQVALKRARSAVEGLFQNYDLEGL